MAIRVNKFLRHDPAANGEALGFEALSVGLSKFKKLVEAHKKVTANTISLATNSGQGNTPVRLLDPILDEMLDAEVNTAVLAGIQELINQLVAELADNGIELTEEALAMLMPTAQVDEPF
jgi:phage gp29-like protein